MSKPKQIEVTCPKCLEDSIARLMARTEMFYGMGPYVLRCICGQVSLHDGKGMAVTIHTGGRETRPD